MWKMCIRDRAVDRYSRFIIDGKHRYSPAFPVFPPRFWPVVAFNSSEKGKVLSLPGKINYCLAAGAGAPFSVLLELIQLV